MASIVSEFLASLPAIGSEEELVARCRDAAAEALNAVAVVCSLWDRLGCEASCGVWPDGARDWLSEAKENCKGEQQPDTLVQVRSPASHCVAAPLKGYGLVPGVLAVCTLQPLTASQEDDLRLLARGTGGAAESLGRSRQDLRRLDQLSLLYDIGKAMNSILDIHKLLSEIMHRGQETLNAEACSVLLVDEERQELIFEIAKGEAAAALEQVRMRLDQGVAGWIATSGEPLIVNDVTKDPRFFSKVDEDVKFRTRSILGVPLLARGKTIGVIEVLNKQQGEDFNQDDLELLTALAADAAISIDNARLFEAVMEGYLDTIKALAAAVDAKDPYTAGHVDRVSTYSIETAELMGITGDELTALRYGAALHDVGKIGIPDAILGKPAPLTDEEFATMRSHTEIASHMLEGIRFLDRAREVARYHHETWDGRGYPDGLKAEFIPRGARIVGVVDAFDAMTTDRPYRKALTIDVAIGELRKKSGIQFDPEVVEAFAEIVKRRGLLG